MCAPGLEVEIELAAPLALGRSVGDDDLDRLVVDLVGNAAPPVQEVAQVRAEGWIGKSNATARSLASHHGAFEVPGLTADGCPARPPAPREGSVAFWRN